MIEATILVRRLEELRKSLANIQNNANAHIGAIQELERLLKESDFAIPSGDPAGSELSKLPSDT